MKVLLCPPHFLHYVYGENFQGQVIWAEIELVRDFMPVLVICKFEEQPNKNEAVIVSTTFFPALKGA